MVRGMVVFYGVFLYHSGVWRCRLVCGSDGVVVYVRVRVSVFICDVVRMSCVCIA